MGEPVKERVARWLYEWRHHKEWVPEDGDNRGIELCRENAEHLLAVIGVDRLEAENEQLREALKRIEMLDYTLDAPIGDEARLTLACMIAREALKEAEDE